MRHREFLALSIAVEKRVAAMARHSRLEGQGSTPTNLSNGVFARAWFSVHDATSLSREVH